MNERDKCNWGVLDGNLLGKGLLGKGIGCKGLLERYSLNLRYLLRDLFNTDRAAGAVNNALAEPGPGTRTVGADTGNQISIASGVLRIVGVAPADNNPRIYNSQSVARAVGQLGFVRFKVGAGKRICRTGFITTAGNLVATIRRTTSEGGGGVLECGSQSLTILDIYDDCWYDFVVSLQSTGAFLCLNTGSGLELVLLSESGTFATPMFGYASLSGNDQDVSIDAWDAPEQTYTPPLLADVVAPANDYSINLGRNDGYITVDVTRSAGNAGIRFRSINSNNEYRFYHDGTNIKLDQVINSSVVNVATNAVAYSPGAKLVVRFNEFLMTGLYNGVSVGSHINRKIGVPELISGTTVGIYSTDAANSFANLKVYPVQLGIPSPLRQSLLVSRKALCVGDSITNGIQAGGYQNKLRKLLGDGWTTIDAGVSGHTAAQISARISQHLTTYSPEYAIILAGTNDIANGVDETTIKAGLQFAYTTAHNAGTRVAAVTILPRGTSSGWSAGKQTILDNVNTWILNTATDVDFRVDAYPIFEDGTTPDKLKAAYDSGDGLHPNAAGYVVLGQTIFEGVTWSLNP
jgi:acyl-CoA thioesterase-1